MKPGADLDAALAALERDGAQHLTAGPADAQELRRIEEQLGVRLPAAYRRFLERFGGGLFYECHEIFGVHRVLIHDIELMTDIVTFCRLQGESAWRPSEYLPFHRSGSVVHLLDLRDPEAPSPAVRSADGSASYPDFVSFLESLGSR
jgi:SMI1 / KNR4 family (SUKH-1)